MTGRRVGAERLQSDVETCDDDVCNGSAAAAPGCAPAGSYAVHSGRTTTDHASPGQAAGLRDACRPLPVLLQRQL